jgi:hypothetical protein
MRALPVSRERRRALRWRAIPPARLTAALRRLQRLGEGDDLQALLGAG